MNGIGQHAPRRVEPEDDADEDRDAAVGAGPAGDPERLGRDELLGVDRRGQDRVVGPLELVLDEGPEHGREHAREEHAGGHRPGGDELHVVVAVDRRDQRPEAEPEGDEVDRRLDRRGERRRLPERREVDDLAHEHAAQRRAFETALHSISSPVSRTNTSSRLAGRRSPSRPCAVAAEDRHAGTGAPRAGAAGARGGLDLGEPGGRPVDLQRLAARVLGDQLRGRPDRHGLAVRHDRHGVREALRLLDVVRGHQDRGPLAAQVVDQRPQLLAHLRVQADGRLVEQDQPRAVHERAGDEQAPAHPARQLVHARLAPVAQVGEVERPLDRGRPLVAADPIEVREDEQVLLGGQRDVEVVELRHDAALCARGLRVVGEHVAEDLELALVGDRLRGEHLHRRRLAGAVGPEQADARPLGDVEVEPVDCA